MSDFRYWKRQLDRKLFTYACMAQHGKSWNSLNVLALDIYDGNRNHTFSDTHTQTFLLRYIFEKKKSKSQSTNSIDWNCILYSSIFLSLSLSVCVIDVSFVAIAVYTVLPECDFYFPRIIGILEWASGYHRKWSVVAGILCVYPVCNSFLHSQLSAKYSISEVI